MCSVGVHLDMTLGIMEEIRYKKKNYKRIQQLTKKYPFTHEELECIFLIYYKIEKNCGEKHTAATKVSVENFLHSAFDITDSTAIDRIFAASCRTPGIYIYVEDFVKMIALFLRGTFPEKLDYCYKCYASYSFEDRISRDVMFHLMNNSVLVPNTEEDSEEVVRDLLEILLKKLDIDRDMKVDLIDYTQSVENNRLLMQCLGPCLPSRLAVHSFLTTFTEHRRRF